MEQPMEQAHETIHEAHHAQRDPRARQVAIMVSVLAAALALAGLGAKSSQNDYLTHHIALSNGWAFYQSKNARAITRDAEAAVLEALPNADTPPVQAKIKAAREYAARMRDDPQGGEGMKQLAAEAKRLEHLRDTAFHLYHGYEYAAGALEISIVLASVSLVTRMRGLTLAAGVIGGLAAAFGLAVTAHLV